MTNGYQTHQTLILGAMLESVQPKPNTIHKLKKRDLNTANCLTAEWNRCVPMQVVSFIAFSRLLIILSQPSATFCVTSDI